MATSEGGYPIITYITDHGIQPPPIEYDLYYNALTEAQLPILSEDGFVFLGWYLSNNYDPSTKVEVGQWINITTGYIYLYAYWMENDKFLIQGDTLVSIADKIRVLSGTTGTMSLDTMKTHVDDANNVIDSQADTISQITEVLNNIGTGGSSTNTLQWIHCNELPTTYIKQDNGADDAKKITVYLELTNDMRYVIFEDNNSPKNYSFIYKLNESSVWKILTNDLDISVNIIEDTDGSFCGITFEMYNDVYALPIYKRV